MTENASYKHIERKLNIELLRILAIMGVIVLHYNNVSIAGGFHMYKREALTIMYCIF